MNLDLFFLYFILFIYLLFFIPKRYCWIPDGFIIEYFLIFFLFFTFLKSMYPFTSIRCWFTNFDFLNSLPHLIFSSKRNCCWNSWWIHFKLWVFSNILLLFTFLQSMYHFTSGRCWFSNFDILISLPLILLFLVIFMR